MVPGAEKSMIEKRTLHVGTKNVEFKNGTKVKFHFQTHKCDAARTLLDDSRTMGLKNPIELVLGKKFKLEVWEAIVQKMALKEVAQFTVDKSLVAQYPFISKTLREIHLPREERGPSCAVSIQNHGLGHDDLNELWNNPCDLQFTLELLDVKQPEDYEKETWLMTDDERTNMVPRLKESGNEEFRAKNYAKASDHYAQAIGILEQLMLKEKPHDVEWNELNAQKVPILLNFAQCKLIEKDYYSVIEHCTSVLKVDNSIVKALYRRAKAHVGAWNPDEAMADFNRVAELDPSLAMTVKKELEVLATMVKKRDEEDKAKYKHLFS